MRALEAALALGLMGQLHPERFDWPSPNDPQDGWLLDLAFESGADRLVSRDKHLLKVGKVGFRTVAPPEVLGRLKPAE